MTEIYKESYSYLYLDSDDRLNKDQMDMTNVSFPINFKANAAVYFALASYDFVYAINNINNNNNVAFIDTATQSFQITLPNGNYNYTALATIIQTQLNIAIPGMTATFANGVYTITSPVAFRFLVNVFYPESRDWADMITMTKPSSPIRQLAWTGGIPDISYTNKIYITCEGINRFKDKVDESTVNRINNCLGVVYVNPNLQMETPSPDTLNQHHATDRPHTLKWIKHKSKYDLGPLSIVLLDDRGLPFPSDQLNKIRWSIEVIVC
jgi:hypothetical protein